MGQAPPPDAPVQRALSGFVPAAGGPHESNEAPTPYQSVTTYNNYYEFGLGKDEPAVHAGTLRTRPWTISIEGEVARPQVVDIDTLLGWFTPEERVYRMRCRCRDSGARSSTGRMWMGSASTRRSIR